MNILLGVQHPDVAIRWKSVLAARNRIRQATSLEELKRLVASSTYDLVLLHRLLFDSAAVDEVSSLAPAAKLFLLSDNPNHEEGLYFLKHGIVGYGNTYISAPRLTEAVHVISSGGVWLGQKVVQQLIHDAHRNPRADASSTFNTRLAILTTMERRVAELVALGETNLEIAADLQIAERTVKAHLTSIYDKLHIGNRLSLALLVNQGGA